MIIMLNQEALINEVLANGDSLGAFMYLENEWICVGAIEWNGAQQTLAVWGNDAANSYQDGLMALDPVVLKAKSEGVMYDVSYAPVIIFEVNGIQILGTSLSFTPTCSDEGSIFGCTNQSYEEYNPLATADDGSCVTIGEIHGCTIDSFLEYNPEATVYDGSCETLVVNGCTDISYS